METKNITEQFIEEVKKNEELKKALNEIKDKQCIIKECSNIKFYSEFCLDHIPAKKNNDCDVCMEPLENYTLKPCGHNVHIECVYKSGKDTCPVCRQKLELTEEERSKIVFVKPEEPDINLIPPHLREETSFEDIFYTMALQAINPIMHEQTDYITPLHREMMEAQLVNMITGEFRDNTGRIRF